MGAALARLVLRRAKLKNLAPMPLTSRFQRFSKALRNVKLNHSCHDNPLNTDKSLVGGLWFRFNARALPNPSAITADGIAQLALAQQRLTNSACSHPHFFSPLTASAGTFPRSSYPKLDALLLIRCPLLQTCECKGRAIGKCFKTAERAHFHVAITSRIREGREEISILGWGAPVFLSTWI